MIVASKCVSGDRRLGASYDAAIKGNTMIVDIHTHIFPPRFIEERARLLALEPGFAALYADPRARMADAEGLLTSMDGAGVDVSVAAGFWWQDRALAEEHAAYLVEAAARADGRIVPFVPLLAPGAPGDAVGVGEVREVDPARIVAGGLPLLVHCSEEVGHAYPGKSGGLSPGGLWSLLEAQPDARVIAAHWGGGFPFYALMPEVRAVIDARRLVFDTAASAFLYGHEAREPAGAVRRGIDLVGLDAVCWGSDFPLREQSVDRDAIEAALQPGRERDAVLGENAARFLGLSS